MEYTNPGALVTTEWLATNKTASNISIIDASFYLPSVGRNPKEEFYKCHIPGAVFFDINKIADQNTDLPHMLPNPDEFSKQAGNLGLSNADHIICYDTNGGPMAAMRAWWTFRVFGHDRVSVLSGGLPKWQSEGHSISSSPQIISQQHFATNLNLHLIKNVEQIIENTKTNKFQVVDARSRGRFEGIEPEPRTGLRQGHIPKSINLPFEKLLDLKNFMIMRSAKELSTIIAEAGIDPIKPLISSCGSGVTAAVLVMALYLLGHTQAAIYDGSWTEWATKPDTPIAN
ncbi:MAG: 3-mercaptopyruvate sulfurtransferase [Pseudomonadota bacterium]|nr:3-mercaptopyruvate sulfurtransferase [Pseudomonadota bacterium]